jgi:hypothetical protein
MIIQQQLPPFSPPLNKLVPFPQPFPQPFPLQQLRSRMIQIKELHPHPPSLHPQFVAAKSLMCDLQNNLVYRILYDRIFFVLLFSQNFFGINFFILLYIREKIDRIMLYCGVLLKKEIGV